jgi:hypothetical protein
MKYFYGDKTRADVYLNGELCKFRILECDDVEGYVVRDKLDQNGNFVRIGPPDDAEFATEKLHGVVRFEAKSR